MEHGEGFRLGIFFGAFALVVIALQRSDGFYIPCGTWEVGLGVRSVLGLQAEKTFARRSAMDSDQIKSNQKLWHLV